MTKNIFYSWQSDLPNNTNRGFIESCLQKAIKDLKDKDLHLEIAIDRDTKGVSGTPDIIKTIFDKISESHVFIADISFIDGKRSKKRSSNPNVLIELGYAAKAIGWENIICIFNGQFGKIEQLPFDLRHRRPLIYQIADTANKTKERELLSRQLGQEISSIIHKQSSKDQIIEYIKLQLDKEVLSICNHIKKLFYGYSKFFTLNDIFIMLELKREALNKIFSESEFIGFQIVKDWQSYRDNLKILIENPTFSKYIDEDKLAPIIQMTNTLMLIELNFKQRNFFNEIDKQADNCEIIAANEMNKSNPEDSYILLAKKNDAKAGKVLDAGIIYKYNLDRALKFYKVKETELFVLTELFGNLLKNLNDTIKKWGDNIMIDPSTFKLH